MPCVARPFGGVELHMYYRDHNPPHFHAIEGGDEALIRIANLGVEKGTIRPQTFTGIHQWATPARQGALALNWIFAQAGMQMRFIP
jgi:hypothetical protein